MLKRQFDLKRVSRRGMLKTDLGKLVECCEKDTSGLKVDNTCLWTKIPKDIDDLDKEVREKFNISGKSAMVWCPPSEAGHTLKPGNICFSRAVVSTVDTVLTVQITPTISKEVFLRAGEAFSLSLIPATFIFDVREYVSTTPRKGFRVKRFKHRLKNRNLFVLNYSPAPEEEELQVTQEMLEDEDILGALESLN